MAHFFSDDFKLKAEALFRVVVIMLECLINKKNRVDNEFYQTVQRELESLRVEKSDVEAAKAIFPRGGSNLLEDYYSFQSAVQFRTKMKHISAFHEKLNTLDNNGLLREFLSDLSKLDNEVEEVIEARVSKLKNNKPTKAGDVAKDLSSIRHPKYNDHYSSLMDNSSPSPDTPIL